jgi:hypothetical protein
MTTRDKYLAKFRLIADILVSVNYLPLNDASAYRFNFRKDPLPGNTMFMAYRRYRKDQTAFDNILEKEYGGDLKKMIQGLR